MARRPTPRQLAARRAFVARYGGGKRKSSPRRAARSAPVARKTSRRSSSRRFGGIAQSSIMDGAMAGAAANIAARYVGPTWGPAAGLAAVGVWRKNPTLQLLAGIQAGDSLAGTFNLPGAAAGSSSGVL